MKQPLVSIVMPVYSRENLVPRAVESVLAQTYSNWEFLVVDDGSNDGTRRVLEGYGERLKITTQANAGAYAARNLALEQAQGELIAFIDSDDAWYPQRLECQIPLLEKPACGLVYGNAALVEYRSGTACALPQTFFDLFPPYRGRSLKTLRQANCIPQSSVLVRRECFEKLGGFSMTSPTGADYAKWVQIARHCEVDYVAECVIEYAFHPGNISRGAVQSYFAPVKLFEELIDPAADPSAQEEMRRFALYFEWNLSLALMRQAMIRMYQAMTRRVGTLPPPSWLRHLDWLMGYLGDKLERRLRRSRRDWKK